MESRNVDLLRQEGDERVQKIQRESPLCGSGQYKGCSHTRGGPAEVKTYMQGPGYHEHSRDSGSCCRALAPGLLPDERHSATPACPQPSPLCATQRASFHFAFAEADVPGTKRPNAPGFFSPAEPKQQSYARPLSIPFSISTLGHQ